MEKFYQTKKFKELQRLWNKKLEASGFIDIEEATGALKNYDRRTQMWDNRERIEAFFRKLDSYLTKVHLPSRDRKILELYARGERFKDIAKKARLNRWTIHKIISIHKEKILESEL